MRGKDDDDDGRAREGEDDSAAGYSPWEYRRAFSCGRSGGGAVRREARSSAMMGRRRVFKLRRDARGTRRLTNARGAIRS